MIDNYNYNIPQGWQCPQCRTIHAPHITMCECMVYTTYATSPPPDDEHSQMTPMEQALWDQTVKRIEESKQS